MEKCCAEACLSTVSQQRLCVGRRRKREEGRGKEKEQQHRREGVKNQGSLLHSSETTGIVIPQCSQLSLRKPFSGQSLFPVQPLSTCYGGMETFSKMLRSGKFLSCVLYLRIWFSKMGCKQRVRQEILAVENPDSVPQQIPC